MGGVTVRDVDVSGLLSSFALFPFTLVYMRGMLLERGTEEERRRRRRMKENQDFA
jgi:hypothetical protein